MVDAPDSKAGRSWRHFPVNPAPRMYIYLILRLPKTDYSRGSGIETHTETHTVTAGVPEPRISVRRDGEPFAGRRQLRSPSATGRRRNVAPEILAIDPIADITQVEPTRIEPVTSCLQSRFRR